MECGAKKKDGTPCKTKAMPNGRCRIHGGATPSGMALPQFKGGRYSKVLPGRLLERYEQAATDNTLLELKHDVALLDTRLADLLGRVDSGESGELWKAVQKAFHNYQIFRGLDDIKAASAFMDLEEAIVAGLADYAAWNEIQSILEQRRKLVESERKRLIEMQQMITSEQAMVLLAAIVDTVRRHVTDRAALAAISADLVQLTARTSSGTIESTGG